MNFSLVELKSFVSVSEYGSFQAAASAIGISQSALTRRVQRLEEGLGARLLERSTRHVSLSAIGREFLPKARRVLDELDASLISIREINGRVSGQLNISCLPTAANSFVPEVLSRFSQDFPRIRVRLIDEVANTVARSVFEGEADIGISLPTSDEPGLQFTPLFEEPFVVACRMDHPLAAQEAVHWHDLTKYSFIRAGRMNGNRALVDITLAKLGLTPTWAYEVQHLTTSLGLIRAGLGVTVLARMAIHNKNFPEIVS